MTEVTLIKQNYAVLSGKIKNWLISNQSEWKQILSTSGCPGITMDTIFEEIHNFLQKEGLIPAENSYENDYIAITYGRYPIPLYQDSMWHQMCKDIFLQNIDIYTETGKWTQPIITRANLNKPYAPYLPFINTDELCVSNYHKNLAHIYYKANHNQILSSNALNNNYVFYSASRIFGEFNLPGDISCLNAKSNPVIAEIRSCARKGQLSVILPSCCDECQSQS